MSDTSSIDSNTSTDTVIQLPPFLPLIIPNSSFPSTSLQRSSSFPHTLSPSSPSLLPPVHPHPFLVDKDLEGQNQAIRRSFMLKAKITIFILFCLLLTALVVISLFCVGLLKVCVQLIL